MSGKVALDIRLSDGSWWVALNQIACVCHSVNIACVYLSYKGAKNKTKTYSHQRCPFRVESGVSKIAIWVLLEYESLTQAIAHVWQPLPVLVLANHSVTITDWIFCLHQISTIFCIFSQKQSYLHVQKSKPESEGPLKKKKKTFIKPTVGEFALCHCHEIRLDYKQFQTTGHIIFSCQIRICCLIVLKISENSTRADPRARKLQIS